MQHAGAVLACLVARQVAGVDPRQHAVPISNPMAPGLPVPVEPGPSTEVAVFGNAACKGSAGQSGGSGSGLEGSQPADRTPPGDSES